MSHPHGAIPDPRLIINQMEIPGQPGVFVLGCYEHNVSILSQQIRAINLVLSLESESRLWYPEEEGKPRTYKHVVVVGNGVAGKTAAAMLKRCHCKVTIIGQDQGSHPNPAQNSHRFIHPYISEFPFSSWANEDPDAASLPVMNWRKGMAVEVYAQIAAEWSLAMSDDSKPNQRGRITAFVGKVIQILWQSPTSYHVALDDGQIVTADLVVLAVGRGTLPTESNYWTDHPLYDQVAATGPDPRNPKASGSKWILAGMGDSNIAEFITLVLQPQSGKSAYQWIIEELAKALPAKSQGTENPGPLQWFCDLERECQYLREPEASTRIDRHYRVLMEQITQQQGAQGNLPSAIRTLLESVSSALKENLPEIQIFGRTPTPFNYRAFPLNRLALALTWHAVKQSEDLAQRERVSYDRGDCGLSSIDNRPNGERAMSQAVAKLLVKVSKSGQNEWHVCDHYNERTAPATPLLEIKLGDKNIDSYANAELKPRNGLDQTRHRMWPYYGNLKRVAQFGTNIEFVMPKSKSNWEGATSILQPLERTIRFCFSTGNTRGRSDDSVELEMCYVPSFTSKKSPPKATDQILLEDDSMRVSGFWISKYPITRHEYKHVMGHGIDHEPSAQSELGRDLPQTGISWIDALAFCRKIGVSLPTDLQWRAAWQWPGEKQRRSYPWGNNGWNADAATPVVDRSKEHVFMFCNAFNSQLDPEYGTRYGICTVHCYEHASGPWGTQQQFGNVLEWCFRDVRPMSHYWSGARGTDWVQGYDPRQRPVGGLSALDTAFIDKCKIWMDFEEAHYATRRPDLGFRIVWMPAPSILGTELNDHQRSWETKFASRLRRPRLLDYDARKKQQSERLKKAHRPSDYTLSRLLDDLNNESSPFKRVEIVLGTWNTSRERGLKPSAALACDAMGLDRVFTNLVKLRPGIEVMFRLASDCSKDDVGEIFLPPVDTLRIFVGSGDVNCGTEAVLKEALNIRVVPNVTFVNFQRDAIFDQKEFTYKASDGLLIIKKLHENPDLVGPVIITAGIGREGTMLANRALADVFCPNAPGRDLLKTDSLFITQKTTNEGDADDSQEYEWRHTIK